MEQAGTAKHRLDADVVENKKLRYNEKILINKNIMEQPTKPNSEKKDRIYFEDEITKLYSEAERSGESNLARMLATVMGALKGGEEFENSLAEVCSSFSKRMMNEIDSSRRKSIN